MHFLTHQPALVQVQRWSVIAGYTISSNKCSGVIQNLLIYWQYKQVSFCIPTNLFEKVRWEGSGGTYWRVRVFIILALVVGHYLGEGAYSSVGGY